MPAKARDVMLILISTSITSYHTSRFMRSGRFRAVPTKKKGMSLSSAGLPPIMSLVVRTLLAVYGTVTALPGPQPHLEFVHRTVSHGNSAIKGVHTHHGGVAGSTHWGAAKKRKQRYRC